MKVSNEELLAALNQINQENMPEFQKNLHRLALRSQLDERGVEAPSEDPVIQPELPPVVVDEPKAEDPIVIENPDAQLPADEIIDPIVDDVNADPGPVPGETPEGEVIVSEPAPDAEQPEVETPPTGEVEIPEVTLPETQTPDENETPETKAQWPTDEALKAAGDAGGAELMSMKIEVNRVMEMKLQGK